jgi:DNA-binding GntR family transcriptional regulator
MAVLTPQKALELYAVRQVLEGMAARLAAIRIDQKSLALMTECLKQQQLVVKQQNLNEYSKLDFQFHAIVYEMCGNVYLQEMLEAIKNKMRPIQLSIQVEPVLPRLYEDHVNLLNALRAHDPDKAEKVFREHNQFMIELINKESEAGRWRQLSIVRNS